ncbi:hypothetical protein QE400_000206 [Xanthomonas sacchari]|uniref:hypothetical protein n=1 Tax=Xanthomonas sacchari TaxID=56458 RepID=UPI0027842FA0|nr:hypothetical protein [Xanthomonas sacchari]MDQ1090793.1 hypothetical protein [Xanthomonas sacchari]
MAKPRDSNPKQLQLRVFSQVDGGLLRNSGSAQTGRQEAGRCEQSEVRSASTEDREIYDAIVERYFSSER